MSLARTLSPLTRAIRSPMGAVAGLWLALIVTLAILAPVVALGVLVPAVHLYGVAQALEGVEAEADGQQDA